MQPFHNIIYLLSWVRRDTDTATLFIGKKKKRKKKKGFDRE